MLMFLMPIKNDALIIGLTGPVFSGCSKLAQILIEDSSFQEFKFSIYSLSKTLRKLHKENNDMVIDESVRSSLQDYGNKLRKDDKAILVKKTLEQVVRDDREDYIIIDSIRNHNEIYELRKFSNFYLIAVNASFDVRYERASKENRNLTKYDFIADDYRDSGIDEPEEGQRVQNCVDLADFLVLNNDNIIERTDYYTNLITKVTNFLNLIKKPGYRFPSTVEVGMNYAYCTSTSSRCNQRAVGAAITRPLSNNSREERMLSVGCNNVPNGVKDCIEMYGKCYRSKIKDEYFKNLKSCPVCKKDLDIPLSHDCGCDESKMKRHYFPHKNLDYCQALHAEENAILRALNKSALGLEGTTLYTSTFPCLLCAKKIIQIDIKKIVYSEPYPVKESVEILNKTLGEENIQPFEERYNQK